MEVDAFVTAAHYWAHLAPIWEALPAGARGTAFAPRRLAQALGAPLVAGYPAGDGGPVLVASWTDEQKVAPRRVVYVEHGAGQTYVDPGEGASPSYSGGPGHDRCVLFICPSESVADRWRVAYPSARAVAVGCPRLDRWHRECVIGADKISSKVTPIVALSFHAHIGTCNETRAHAFDEVQRYLPALKRWADEAGVHLLGHGHPRIWGRVERAYRGVEIERVENFDEVLARADAYVIDNSSTGWEAMSVGIPVVWVNASRYRRDVEHGLRFWEWADSGVQAEARDGADGLATAIQTALIDPPGVRRRRQEAVRHVYAHTDGRAAQRAAAAVLSVLSETAVTA